MAAVETFQSERERERERAAIYYNFYCDGYVVIYCYYFRCLWVVWSLFVSQLVIDCWIELTWFGLMVNSAWFRALGLAILVGSHRGF